MKSQYHEQLRRRMKQYHRAHPWRLGDQGLMIPHAYPEKFALSWWDDVGFILNKRRVMVWWVHPRMKYRDAIESMAFSEAGKAPSGSLLDDAEKKWKRVGRSRKKVSSWVTQPAQGSHQDYYDKVNELISRKESEGIDLVVHPSMKIQTLWWCTGIELCAPLDVGSKEEVVALARLAKRLIKGETTLEMLFPDYQYGRKEWLQEAALRIADRETRQSTGTTG